MFNLSASATRDDLSLIAVVMRADTSKLRFSEATKLLDYGFSNFEYTKYSNKGDIAKTVNIEKGISKSVDVAFEQDAGALIPKGQSSNIVTTVNIPDSFEAPIAEGQILGKVSYSIGDEILGEINLVASSSVPKLNLGNMMASVINKWINLIR